MPGLAWSGRHKCRPKAMLRERAWLTYSWSCCGLPALRCVFVQGAPVRQVAMHAAVYHDRAAADKRCPRGGTAACQRLLTDAATLDVGEIGDFSQIKTRGFV